MTDIVADRLSSDADEIEREAYNAAFYELELGWYWDAGSYAALAQAGMGPGARLQRYLEAEQPHLLKAYDAGFLVAAIEAAKERCLRAMQAGGRAAAPRVNWAEFQHMQIGI